MARARHRATAARAVRLALLASPLAGVLSGCGTLRTVSALEDGAGPAALQLWDRWVDSGGDIAAEYNLQAETGRVRDAIRALIDRGAAGEF